VTKFFRYDSLTWPEAAMLHRGTPLIIPFGNGYAFNKIAESLNHPQSIGLLPALPFGWRGSPLEVEEDLFVNCVSNLLDNLQDDGFSQVYALTPQGVCMRLGARRIAQSVQSKFAVFQSRPSEKDLDKVVVIPIGHTEQHSYHLPLSTDTVIIDAIAKGIQELAPDLALTLPVMPFGVSTHRASFAGTLNLGGRCFEDFWLDIIKNLVQQGFSRFYLISGHGGNCSFLTNVVKYTGELYYHAFIATAWLYLSGPSGVAALQEYRQSPIGGMGHACELETSLMLYLQPDLVFMDRVIDETTYISTPSFYMDWVEGGALIANPPWEDDVVAGAYGAGSLGTAKKGELWLTAAIQEKIDHIHEIQQQYELRINRRQKRINSST
jgi:creatinine amidohydrolase